MKRLREGILLSVVVVLLFLAAVCWHSVEEIHDLKTFFPASFTVEEAYYAGIVELVKISIIAVPVWTAIAVCLILLRLFARDR